MLSGLALLTRQGIVQMVRRYPGEWRHFGLAGDVEGYARVRALAITLCLLLHELGP